MWNDMRARMYAAEFGRVALASLLTVIAATLIMETAAPGLTGNWVSAQSLVLCAVAAGALGLLAPAPREGALTGMALAGAAGLAGLVAYIAARAYFAPMPPLLPGVPLAAAFAAALPFLVASRSVGRGAPEHGSRPH